MSLLQYLPSLPTAATLEVVPYWAVGGAALGFGAILVQWLIKPGVFGDIVREPPRHIPGAPKPDDPARSPWGPAGLGAAALGAAVAALWAWGWYGPEEEMRGIGVFVALVGVGQSLRQLLRTVRDVPAVGEAPPADPEDSVATRLRKAWSGIALAGLGLVMAVF